MGLPFMLGKAIDISAHIARGMEALHARGYTHAHTNLKLGNVMVMWTSRSQTLVVRGSWLKSPIHYSSNKGRYVANI